MPADTESRPPPPQETTPAGDPGQMPPPEAFKAATSRLAEFADYVRQYFAARIDLAKLRVRRIILYAALGVVGFIALTALIVTLVVMLCMGFSGLIATALGGRAWAGDLIVGGGLIIILSLGVWLFLRRANNKHLRQTMQRYEQRQREQRENFGHDSSAKAGESSSTQ